MTRARERLLFFFGALGVFDRKGAGPVGPVPVADDQGDRRADGVRVPDARHDLDRVFLDLHAAAAAVTLLAPPQLAIDERRSNGHAGRKTGQSGDQALPVRLAGGFEAQHVAKNFMVAGGWAKWRRPLAWIAPG